VNITRVFPFNRSAPPFEKEYEREKVFCIGLNKTGTTSLEHVLKRLGYELGDQHAGEKLLPHYLKRDFKPIIDFACSADAFQDAPFSYPITFLPLDQAFPNARFILTVRDDVDQWYQSLVRFHAKLFAGGRVPVKEDLQKATYGYPGFVWEAHRHIFNTPDDDIYNAQVMSAFYENHNYVVRQYFRTKKNFLEINLSDKGAYLEMCDFLGKDADGVEFPRLNKG
jgi:hypothetical protein